MDKVIEPAPFLWIEEGREEAYTPRTRRRTKKKKEFVGWGSRQLIEFLDSVGRETSKALSQHDVTEIIIQYVNERRLINPDKKKRVICDERLQALFGRKSVGRVKIYDLLEAHLAENQVDSDDDLFYSSEERVEEESVYKRQRVTSSDRKTQPKMKVPEVSKTCLAAISPENIKLVYLKRTLVQELFKHPETFEGKVVGSFVRIKSDPLDIFQKNSHQLQLVTGVKAVAAASDDSSCTLLISGATHEISVSALSDENFSEEECEDLRKRVKEGLIKQLTVGELEGKVEVLHEDVTRHWLTRELALLKNLIDRANEKGWRHRVTEYLDKRRLLQTPSEQSRLLTEIPKVKAEEMKAETLPDSLSDGENGEDSPKAFDWDWEPCYDSRAKGSMIQVLRKHCVQAEVEIGTGSNGDAPSSHPEKEALPEPEVQRTESNGHTDSFEPKQRYSPEKPMKPNSNGHSKSLSSDHISCTMAKEKPREESNGPLQPRISEKRHVSGMAMAKENVQSKQVEVIDLSDDDEEQEVPNCGQQVLDPFPELLLWHYLDPRGNVQGPFSLTSLKRWRDADYFPPSFRVWRTGQSPHEAVLLNDILRQIFLN